MISAEFRDWVNEKVLSYLPIQRQRVGDKIICRCPLCGDSKKNSMKKRGYYYLNTASYYCFNCGENLTGMKLLERLSGEDYQSLKDEYIRMVYDGKHFSSRPTTSRSVKYASNSLFSLKNVVKKEWKNPLSDKAKEYLEKRKVLDSPFLRENLYSYYSKKGDEYILIPWKMNGTDCYFQLNDFEKHNKNGMKYIFPKNMDKMIYGLDNINLKYDFIIITEGVYDSLFLPNCIAVGGRFISDSQLDIVRKRFPKMKLCLSFDNDGPGLESMKKSLKDKRYNFSYFKWFGDDTKQKDINDYILANGNANIFKNEEYVQSCIVDPVIMKMWMSRKGIL